MNAETLINRSASRTQCARWSWTAEIWSDLLCLCDNYTICRGLCDGGVDEYDAWGSDDGHEWRVVLVREVK